MIPLLRLKLVPKIPPYACCQTYFHRISCSVGIFLFYFQAVNLTPRLKISTFHIIHQSHGRHLATNHIRQYVITLCSNSLSSNHNLQSLSKSPSSAAPALSPYQAFHLSPPSSSLHHGAILHLQSSFSNTRPLTPLTHPSPSPSSPATASTTNSTPLKSQHVPTSLLSGILVCAALLLSLPPAA